MGLFSDIADAVRLFHLTVTNPLEGAKIGVGMLAEDLSSLAAKRRFPAHLTGLCRQAGLTPRWMDAETCHVGFSVGGHNYSVFVCSSGVVSAASRYDYSHVSERLERIVSTLNGRATDGGWRIETNGNGRRQIFHWTRIDPFKVSPRGLAGGLLGMAQTMANLDGELDKLGL
jgi:hypothetical protein